MTLICYDCKGTGEISDQQAAWREEGARLRADRLARDLGLTEEARRRGLRPVELADMEHGRRQPEWPDA